MIESKVLIREADDDDIWVSTYLLNEGEDDEQHVQRFAENTPDGDPVSYGAGSVDAGTRRYTHANDDPLVTRFGEVSGTPTANTLLGRLKALGDGWLTSLGVKTASNSLSVTVASDDALAAATGAKNDAAATNDTGTFSLIALVKRWLEKATLLVAGIGGVGDAAWASGSGSVIALLKSAATSLATLTEDAGAADTAETPGTPYRNLSVDETEDLVAAGDLVLTYYWFYNPHATDEATIHLYDAASVAGVTVGTTEPKMSFTLGPKKAANASLNAAFLLGIVIAATLAETGSTAPSADLKANLTYRTA